MQLSIVSTIALALSASLASAADLTSVKCWSNETGGEKQAIQLKLDPRGKITPWKGDIIAKGSKKSDFFFLLTNSQEAVGVEYTKSFIAPNGYSIVTVGTTADEVSVGVHADRKKGFYSYRDTGSGNGHKKFVLTCE